MQQYQTPLYKLQRVRASSPLQYVCVDRDHTLVEHPLENIERDSTNPADCWLWRPILGARAYAPFALVSIVSRGRGTYQLVHAPTGLALGPLPDEGGLAGLVPRFDSVQTRHPTVGTELTLHRGHGRRSTEVVVRNTTGELYARDGRFYFASQHAGDLFTFLYMFDALNTWNTVPREFEPAVDLNNDRRVVDPPLQPSLPSLL